MHLLGVDDDGKLCSLDFGDVFDLWLACYSYLAENCELVEEETVVEEGDSA